MLRGCGRARRDRCRRDRSPVATLRFQMAVLRQEAAWVRWASSPGRAAPDSRFAARKQDDSQYTRTESRKVRAQARGVFACCSLTRILVCLLTNCRVAM